MSVTILTHAEVMVSTSTSTGSLINISSFVRSLEFTRTYDIHDVTTMGNTDRARRAGLAEFSFSTSLLQSFSTDDALGGQGSLDALLNTLADIGQGGGSFYVRLLPDSRQAHGPSNPYYYGQMILEEYSPITGEVGDPVEMDVPFISAGSLGVDRTTNT